MPIATPICDLLQIEHPILLAPMAGVGGGALARAVSAAGGLGLIGGGYGDQIWLKRALADAGDARVGVGFITWALDQQPHLLDIALDHEPAALFLSFGEIGGLAARIKRADVPLIAQVQSVRQARVAVEQGADLVVAQGAEAGGHAGVRATLPLVPAVVDAVGPVPVIAAGGIGDGRAMAAALMLGASGVLCGTAFFASDEALSHENAKTAAIAAGGDDTDQSAVFDVARGIDWPDDWKLRALVNRFSGDWRDRQALLANDARVRALFERASVKGDTDIAPVIVGEAVDMVRAAQPAARIVQQMVEGAEAVLRSATHHLTPRAPDTGPSQAS